MEPASGVIDASLRAAADPYFAERRALVERFINDLLLERFPADDPKAAALAAAVAYSLENGGKRIRPILLLAAAELYRPIDERALQVACALELVHTATLMLDDLPSMDDAAFRRGKPANHRVFGESTTILAALSLWSEAVRLLGAAGGDAVADIVQETAEAVGQRGLARGQYLDLASFGKPQTRADLDECAYFKTAVLFKNALRLGAYVGGAPEEERAALSSFGEDFGYAFQIRDDLLDAEATCEETGKDAGADAKNGRATYATVLGAGGARQLLAEKIAALSHALARVPRDTNRLASFVHLLEAV